MEPRKAVCLAIVSPDHERLKACVEAVRKQGFIIVGAGSVEIILGEIDGWRTDIPRPSLFVLVGVPAESIPASLDAIRSNPATTGASIMVVDENLKHSQVDALMEAGVIECWTKPFLAPMFSARVRRAVRGIGTAG